MGHSLLRSKFVNKFLINSSIVAILSMMASSVYAQCFDISADFGVSTTHAIQAIHEDFGCKTKTLPSGVLFDSLYWKAEAAPADHPRHKIITTTGGTDALCPQLSTLPTGATAVIQIASDDYGAEDTLARGGGVAFKLPAVSASDPTFTLWYAISMENPKHAILKDGETYIETYAQPWIEMTIINQTSGQNLYNTCYFPSTVSKSDGWQTYKPSVGVEVQWKDWSKMSVDLSKYIGQDIIVLITTRDCAIQDYKETQKKRYAFCTSHHRAHFYCTTLCENNEIKIQQQCSTKKTTLSLPEGYTSYKWYRKDDTKKTTLHNAAVYTFDTPEDNVTYCCVIKDAIGNTYTYEKEVNSTSVYVSCDTTICRVGSSLDGFSWKNTDFTGRTSPCDTTFTKTTSGGCDSIVTLRVRTRQPYNLTIDRTIHEGQTFEFMGEEYTTAGTYTQTVTSASGCDSTITVNLSVLPAIEPTTDNCFNLNYLGNKGYIACFDRDVNITRTKKAGVDVDEFGWSETIMSETVHPRHTLITKEGFDNLCPELQLLPDGQASSIRLAPTTYPSDTDVIAQGEAIYVRYDIDPSNPVVYFDYAAVMEIPDHLDILKKGIEHIEGYAQPWMQYFLMGVDKKGKEVQINCPNTTLFATTEKGKEGWTTFTDSRGYEAIWRDWTRVTIDLSEYVGTLETIFLIVRSHDCALQGTYGKEDQLYIRCRKHHECHVYCNFTCGATGITMEQTCIPENTTALSVIDGYTAYNWYEKAAPSTSLGTTRTITIPTPLDTVEYCCTVTDECGKRTFTQTVMTTTIQTRKDTTVCGIDLQGFIWHGQDFSDGETTKTFTTTSVGGCDSVVTLHVNLILPKQWAIERTIQAGMQFQLMDTVLTTSGVYKRSMPSYTGCDSTIMLMLNVEPATTQEEDDECFDLNKIGNKNHIACFNFDTKVDKPREDLEVFRIEETQMSETNHPRHTLITKEGFDNLCPQLNRIQKGTKSSLCLSPTTYLADTNDIAHGASYYIRYNADANHPILHFNYAAVMEVPHHDQLMSKQIEGMAEYGQPWVRIELLGVDKNQQIVSLDCPSITYYASELVGKEGWTNFTDLKGKDAVWKDWSELLIDLSDYIDTYPIFFLVARVQDCSIENTYGEKDQLFKRCRAHHESHLYCNISCSSRDMDIQQTCTPEQTTTLTAPDGFYSYNWFKKSEPNNSLGTTPTISFSSPTKPTDYCCQLGTDCGLTVMTETVLPTGVYAELDTTICKTDIAGFEWHGERFSETELVKQKHLKTVDGCDSTVTLTVLLYQSPNKTITTTICQGDGYQLIDTMITTPGTYQRTTQGYLGCDSTITLYLSVNPSYANVEDGTTICENELSKFRWEGIRFSGTESKTKTLKTVAGCDSIVTFHLTVISPVAQQTEDVACKNQMPYIWETWRSHEIKKGGIYYDTLQSEIGCDSIYYVLELEVNDEEINGTVDYPQAICANATEFAIDFDYTAGSPDSFKVEFDEIARLRGFKNIEGTYEKHTPIYVPIPIAKGDTTKYVRPDFYQLNLIIIDDCGRRNSFPIEYAVYYPSWLITQHWNDALALLNKTYNGGYEFTAIRWFNEDKAIESFGENNSYIHVRPTLNFGQKYWAELTRKDDGRKLCTCAFIPTEKAETQAAPERLRIATYSEGTRQYLRFVTTQGGSFQVYDISGKSFLSRPFNAGENTLPYVGTMGENIIIIFYMDDGTIETRKITFM